ncbi:MAG: endonuclease Q family protein [Candidatus Hodarchaeales archaeon]|jgi:PHP family Zn ribbon phosphoesterase
MELTADLHAHSVFAGGTQALKQTPEKFSENKKKAVSHLIKTNETMPLKGIELIGTGDCQFTIWTEILREVLVEDLPGIFFLEGNFNTRFILQTEIIFTLPVQKHSKIVHVVFLFPNFTSVDSFRDLLNKWEVKHEKMARPFVKCESQDQVADRIFKILDIDPLVEIIPAHIMTPQGVFGSNIKFTQLSDFFGTASDRIKVLETGLSADPQFLGLIPELDNKTLVSNSDAHSSALHRMGREFTVLNVSKIQYSHIIQSLRNNKVKYTVEFPPEEGRFFLTGHRSGRKKPGFHDDSQYCYFSPQHVPKGDICPICHKKLTIGVFQRCVEIGRAQGSNRTLNEVTPTQKYISMVPLIDILSKARNVKTKQRTYYGRPLWMKWNKNYQVILTNP